MKDERLKTLTLLNAYRIIFTSSPDGLPLEGIDANELAGIIESSYRSGKIDKEELYDGALNLFFGGKKQCQE